MIAPGKSSAAPSSVWTRWDLVICLALLGAITGVFWQVKHHDFITYDDPNYVTQNLRVQAGLTRANVAWAFQTTSESNWHPLTWLSHMLDCQLFGLNAGAHHLVNVFFHALNSLLLFAVFKRMTGARWRSAVVAALFALHPLHVESVAWISERKDVLSTFFWLLTMGAYVLYAERRGPWRYCLALVAFALGLMSKPMLVTLPCVLLLLDFWPLGRFRWGTARAPQASASPKRAENQRVGVRSLILEKIPFLLLAAASCVVTYLAQQKGKTVITASAVPIADRLGNAIVSYGRYIGKMVWPENLAVFYPYVRARPAGQIAGATLLLIALTALAFWGRRNHRYLSVGWLWYLGTLIPVIGLVQIGAQSMADRYTYVPLIGLFVMIAWGAVDLSKRWQRKAILRTLSAGAALAGCLIPALFQVQIWKDSLTLFEHALGAGSDSAVVRFNLGYALLAKGRPEEALVHFTAGLQRDPRAYWVYSNIGDILAGQGKLDQAVAKYSEALRLQPDYTEAHGGLALALAGQGRHTQAVAHLTEALRLKPDESELHFRLAMVLEAQKRTPEAVAQYREALRLKGNSISALNNLAWLLATHDDAAIRNGDEAVRYAERACELTGQQQAFLLGTLAAAYAEAGRFSEAVSTAQKAAELAGAAGQKELAATNQRLLELYRVGKTYAATSRQAKAKAPDHD